MTELKIILLNTYQRRREANPGYSRNAFARDLKISPTALSQFLADKRTLSRKNIQRIVAALGLPDEDVESFVKVPRRPPEPEKAEIDLTSQANGSSADWNISSFTMLFDPKSIAQIKREIDKFKNNIARIGRASKGSEVYSLNIQFFPISNGPINSK